VTIPRQSRSRRQPAHHMAMLSWPQLRITIPGFPGKRDRRKESWAG